MENPKLQFITQFSNNPEIKENIANSIAIVNKNRKDSIDYNNLNSSTNNNNSITINETTSTTLPYHSPPLNEELKLNTFISHQKYSWSKEGTTLITASKTSFTHKERTILKSLLLTPVPPSLRRNLWLISSGAKREIQNNPNYYTNLTTNYPETSVPSPYITQIDLDIKRTFPNDTFFHNPLILRKLRNVLIAYSRRNTTIGYAQGFNFIVGKILKQIPNEVRITKSMFI